MDHFDLQKQYMEPNMKSQVIFRSLSIPGLAQFQAAANSKSHSDCNPSHGNGCHQNRYLGLQWARKQCYVHAEAPIVVCEALEGFGCPFPPLYSATLVLDEARNTRGGGQVVAHKCVSIMLMCGLHP